MAVTSVQKVETGLYKRGGTYLVAVYAGRDPTSGQKKRRWATAATLDQARQLRRRLQQEAEKAGRVPPQRIAFGEFAWGRWWEETTHSLKPKTRRGYRNILEKHLAPKEGGGLSQVRLDRLAREHIADCLRAKRKAGLHEQTLANHYQLPHRILECAVRWGYAGPSVLRTAPPAQA